MSKSALFLDSDAQGFEENLRFVKVKWVPEFSLFTFIRFSSHFPRFRMTLQKRWSPWWIPLRRIRNSRSWNRILVSCLHVPEICWHGDLITKRVGECWQMVTRQSISRDNDSCFLINSKELNWEWNIQLPTHVCPNRPVCNTHLIVIK